VWRVNLRQVRDSIDDANLSISHLGKHSLEGGYGDSGDQVCVHEI